MSRLIQRLNAAAPRLSPPPSGRRGSVPPRHGRAPAPYRAGRPYRGRAARGLTLTARYDSGDTDGEDHQRWRSSWHDWCVSGQATLGSEVRLRVDGLGLSAKGKRDLRWRAPTESLPESKEVASRPACTGFVVAPEETA